MAQFAYAVARSSSVETIAPARRMAPAAAARQARAGAGFDLGRKIGIALLVAAMLVLVGWGAARAMDSTLLGFVFADLLFLVGVALRGAVAPARGPSRRTR